MTKTKTDYVLRSLSKISRKKWEYFIISRIIHGLNDDDLEFVTQQFVLRPNGKRALTDLYFPQLGVHLEIDEPHHANHLESDAKREQDIVRATDDQIRRINILNAQKQERSLVEVCKIVDEFIHDIRALKATLLKEGRFTPWDWEMKYSSIPVIERGYLDTNDNVTFRLQIEALKCFGFTGNGYQRGAWRIPDNSGDWVWFPRLYEHYIWNNELSADGLHVYERALDGNEEARSSIAAQIDYARKTQQKNAIVFAKARDSLGSNLLRYVGTFRLNFEASNAEVIQFDLVRTREPVRSL